MVCPNKGCMTKGFKTQKELKKHWILKHETTYQIMLDEFLSVKEEKRLVELRNKLESLDEIMSPEEVNEYYGIIERKHLSD